MLARVVERVRAARLLDRVIVATSTDVTDDPLADFCGRHDISCHRGPLEDVAARMTMAAAAEGAEAFVRVTGDSPLIDPAVIDQAVALYKTGAWDLVSNVLVRSFPIGQSVEVLRTDTFASTRETMTNPLHREHITQFYYANPGSFRILGFTSGMDAGSVQLSVDTPEDFSSVEKMLACSGGTPGTWQELASLKKALP
jgi:spore coat polysaccharide biosynthesis protein SpsF